MKIRFFGSSNCRDCLELFVLLNKLQIDYEYIDALDEAEEIQNLCDRNDVYSLPHLQFFDDEDCLVLEQVGPIDESSFIRCLSEYFPNY